MESGGNSFQRYSPPEFKMLPTYSTIMPHCVEEQHATGEGEDFSWLYCEKALLHTAIGIQILLVFYTNILTYFCILICIKMVGFYESLASRLREMLLAYCLKGLRL